MSRAAQTKSEILPGVRRRELAFDQYRDFIAEDGDFLLWEPHGKAKFIGRFIAAATDGPFCHASGVAFNHGQVWQYAYEEGHDGYGSPLWYSVKRYPGLISVFKVQGPGIVEQHQIARHYVHDLTGEYNWPSIRAIALGQSLGLKLLCNSFDGPMRRWYQRVAASATRRTKGAICSRHVHRSIRMGINGKHLTGMNMISKDEAFITPNDLARWSAAKYVGSLMVPTNWRR